MTEEELQGYPTRPFSENGSGRRPTPEIEDRLLAAGIKPTDRAEVVSLEQFCALARGFEG